jgi:hypothetical protein
MLDVIARGDSIPDVVDLNRKLIIFFLHGNNLYYWTRPLTGLKLVGNCDSESLTKIDDERFLYKIEETMGSNDYFIINQVNVVFSSF